MVKVVVDAIYCHKTNVEELLQHKKCKINPNVLYNLLSKFDKSYDIIKYTDKAITLIESPDWDIANEPLVGTQYRFSIVDLMQNNYIYKELSSKGQIYHNKWQFVRDDYAGFSIEEAKSRTLLWNSIPNIKSHKSRIGYKKYWEKLLVDNGIPL